MVVQILQQMHDYCEFPDSWKIAHITPIPKVHNPSSHLNIDQPLFFQYCQSYLKKLSITEYTLIWQNTI